MESVGMILHNTLHFAVKTLDLNFTTAIINYIDIPIPADKYKIIIRPTLSVKQGSTKRNTPFSCRKVKDQKELLAVLHGHKSSERAIRIANAIDT